MDRALSTPPPNLETLKRQSALKLKSPVLGPSPTASASRRPSGEVSKYGLSLVPPKPATSSSQFDASGGSRHTFSDISSSETETAVTGHEKPLDSLLSQWAEIRQHHLEKANKGAGRLAGTRPVAGFADANTAIMSEDGFEDNGHMESKAEVVVGMQQYSELPASSSVFEDVSEPETARKPGKKAAKPPARPPTKPTAAGKRVAAKRAGGKAAPKPAAAKARAGVGRTTPVRSSTPHSVLSNELGFADVASAAEMPRSGTPSGLQRLDRAVSRMVRSMDHRVSIVEVHDALLGVMKAAALRDAYRTVTAVLSDVPLAATSLPEPHNAALEEVVGVLVSLRGAVADQVAAAKRAIAKGDAGPAEGLESDLGLGEALRILAPSPGGSSRGGPSPAPSDVAERQSTESPAPSIDINPASYLFPSSQPPVAYYGDADFSAVNDTMQHADGDLPAPSVDQGVSIPEVMARVPPATRVAFQSMRDVWSEKLRLEEAFGRSVVEEKAKVLADVWTHIQRVSALALPLVAEARSTYVGQLARLEALAKRDADENWDNPKARVDLKWHAAVRLYSAFAKHAILPRFKLNSSLPPKLNLYLRALVKGATEEEREGIDSLDDRLSDGGDSDLEGDDDGDAWRRRAADGTDDDTCTKRLGQFLRDPSVWWAGFNRQWKANQLTLARRFWRRCQRGEPSSNKEMLDKFKEAGKRWRQGKGDVSWSDIRSGDETQWGGARWSERVAWVHSHLLQMARDANVEWRERASRRTVYRAVNEQLRADIFGIMLFVGESIVKLQRQALDALAQRALLREKEFRMDISRLSHEEITLAKGLEREAATNPDVAVALRVITRRLRPTQLTAHRRIIKAHLKELSVTVDSVGAAALQSTT